MASIVWRWNHVDNPKNQVTKYGYPNDRLWADLNLFYALREVHQATVDNEDKDIQIQQRIYNESRKREAERAERFREKRRLENLAWEAGREERERLATIRENERKILQAANSKRRREKAKELFEKKSEQFLMMCDYYNMPSEIDTNDLSNHELYSITVIKAMIEEGRILQSSHLMTLKRILGGNINE
tara:strand:- start:677 stop:1237 length:561 start_codon:yes stop_codon:yes gene_type:complete